MNRRRPAGALPIALFAAGVSIAAPAAGSNRAPPTARLLNATGSVEVGLDERHAAAAGEPLEPGTRVQSREDATASLAIGPAAWARLEASSQLVMFGAPTPPVRGATPTHNVYLVRGGVHLTLPEGTPRDARAPLDVPGGTITLLHGEAAVTVDAARITRVAVYRGRARVRAGAREMVLRAGWGVRIDAAAALGQPRVVLPAPRWAEPLPDHLFARNSPVELRGRFELPVGRQPPIVPLARWRVQLARDAEFRDIVLDRIQPDPSDTRFAADVTQPGRYFARATGVDAEHVEGVPGTASTVVITAPRVVPATDSQRAMVVVPVGMSCGLDGARPAPRARPIPLLPARPHQLHCTTAEGPAYDLAISAADAGPVRHRVQLAGFTPGTRSMSVVVLRLQDADGSPLPYATVDASANPGVIVEDPRETDERGVYTSTVAWQPSVRGLRLQFTVNNAPAFEHVVGEP